MRDSSTAPPTPSPDGPRASLAPGSGGRRLYVGDVQGCRAELDLLLEAFDFVAGRDRLRPVGDLVNRGPDSLGVLRRAIELEAEAVLGNHDLHLLRVAAGRRSPRPGDTLGAVLDAPDRAALLGWLAAQPLLRADPDLFQVHAGLAPTWRDPQRLLAGIDPLVPDPLSDFCTRARYCDAAGRLPADDRQDPGGAFRPWFELYRAEHHGGRGVIFGHWAVRGLVRSGACLGLDTGCVWGGRLTGYCPEEDRLLSVPALRRHCDPATEG
jgi:bis(5'-nucleosyl)-tetraphosphatase (symmetrical)